MSSSPADDEIDFELFPFIRLYRSGRIERLSVRPSVPPSPCDPLTGVTSKDVVVDPSAPASARLYLPHHPSSPSHPKLPLLVYFHGGAFCIESAFSLTYHPYLNSLSARAGALVVSVEYRLAPENPLPAAYEDSWVALRWAVGGSDPWIAAHADLNRVFLAGDSAGANIAHRMAVRAGAEGVKLEGTAAIHPYFSTGEEEKGTLGDKLWRLVCPGAIGGTGDPRLNPAAEIEGAVKGMAGRRAVVFLAEKDALRENGKAYCEVLRGSGWEGVVELVVTEGEGHVFHLIKPESDKAGELMERLVAFLKGASE